MVYCQFCNSYLGILSLDRYCGFCSNLRRVILIYDKATISDLLSEQLLGISILKEDVKKTSCIDYNESIQKKEKK